MIKSQSTFQFNSLLGQTFGKSKVLILVSWIVWPQAFRKKKKHFWVIAEDQKKKSSFYLEALLDPWPRKNCCSNIGKSAFQINYPNTNSYSLKVFFRKALPKISIFYKLGQIGYKTVLSHEILLSMQSPHKSEHAKTNGYSSKKDSFASIEPRRTTAQQNPTRYQPIKTDLRNKEYTICKSEF